jgi:hypothetical protein
VIVIPATAKQVDGTNENNMLPKQGTVTPVISNSASGVTLCGASNNKLMAMLAGKDQEMGEMTIISDASSHISGAAGKVGAEKVGAGATNTQALPTAYASATLNDNAHATATEFDINAKTAAQWLIGAAKLDAVTKFGIAKAIDWNDPQAVLEICEAVAGAVIPSTLDVHEGDLATGTKCTGVYQYTVGLQDPLVTSGYATRKVR